MDESFLRSSSLSRTTRGAQPSSFTGRITPSPANGSLTRVLVLVYIWIQEIKRHYTTLAVCHLLFIEIYLPYVFTFFMLTLMRFELLWVCFSITSCFSSYEQHVGLSKAKLTSGFQLESCEERQTLIMMIWDAFENFARLPLDHKQYSNLIYGISLLNLAAIWTSIHSVAEMFWVTLSLVIFGFKFDFILTLGKHSAVPVPRSPFPLGGLLHSQ